MNNKKNLVFALVRYSADYEFLSSWSEKAGIKEEDLNKVLKEKQLVQVDDRAKYIWSLDNTLENSILGNVHKLDELYLIQEVKNRIEGLYSNIKFDEESFSKLLSSRSYKGIDDMRAFIALCDGDIDIYNTYSKDRKDMLSKYIIKTLILCDLDYTEIKTFYEFTKELIDKKPKKYTSYMTELRQEWRYKEELLKGFREFYRGEKPVYVDGILNIIKESLQSARLYDKVIQVIENKYNKVTEIDTIDINIDEFEISPEIVVDISIETQIDQKINGKNDYDKIKYHLTETLNLLSNLEENRNNELQDEINRLEEENNRLKNKIDVLSSRASAISLKEFIQTMGGREYGYQLTDLYLLSEDIMNDDGNIPGRLINMFALLSAYNIEPYTSGKEIGDIFEIELKELAQKYSLESQIKETDEKIKVELLKFGWKQNRDILVQPLVKQVL